tara:strand:+ start:1991 stop:2485 length:495 start_codon:yes stop_codon:yes gene_type:complete
MNNYDKQLKQSLSKEDKDFWCNFIDKTIDWDVNLNQEYDGIDAIIENKNIQFKLREKYYNDILIEFSHSNGERGWINKLQKCDYIIYGWRNYNKIFIFDWEKLTYFWNNNQVLLFKKYGKKNVQAAINKNKITYNYSIPFKELKDIYTVKETRGIACIDNTKTK